MKTDASATLKRWVAETMDRYDQGHLTASVTAVLLATAILCAASMTPTSHDIVAQTGLRLSVVAQARRRAIEMKLLNRLGAFQRPSGSAADSVAKMAVKTGRVQELAWELQNATSADEE